MANKVSLQTLSNGFTVILEEIPSVQSVAYTLLVPSGVIYDDPRFLGCNLLLTELTTRGAGGKSSKDLSDAFDSLGVRHAESTGLHFASYKGALLGENLPKALPLLASMVLDP